MPKRLQTRHITLINSLIKIQRILDSAEPTIRLAEEFKAWPKDRKKDMALVSEQVSNVLQRKLKEVEEVSKGRFVQERKKEKKGEVE